MAKQPSTGIFMTGDKEIDQKLLAFEVKVQKKVARKSTRAGAKAVLESVRADAPYDFGTLAATLKVRALRVSRRRGTKIGHMVVVGEGDQAGLFSGDAYYAGFLEFSTKERYRKTKRGARTGRIAEHEHDFIRRNLYSNADRVRRISVSQLRQAISEAGK